MLTSGNDRLLLLQQPVRINLLQWWTGRIEVYASEREEVGDRVRDGMCDGGLIVDVIRGLRVLNRISIFFFQKQHAPWILGDNFINVSVCTLSNSLR